MSSDRRKLFVAAYLALPKQREAAITAGYSEKTAHAMACKLMKDPRIAAEIAAGQAKLAKRFEITADNVLQELAAIASANMADFIEVDAEGRVKTDLKPVTRQQWKAVQQCKIHADGSVTLKLKDDRAALVDLAKHLGLFKPASPFDDPGDAPAEENTPMREVARELVLAFQLAMRGQRANDAAPAAPPIKH